MACPSEPVAKKRYVEKIKAIGGLDPYQITRDHLSSNPDDLPNITQPDIFTYLVLEKSKYTADEFKAYKGLQAFNQVNNGWVTDVACLKQPPSKNVLVTAKVAHSQKLSEKSLSPWIITEDDGKILSAHCDCMAGLGETCTHVAAVMFYVETQKRFCERVTVTGKSAYWAKPSGTAKAEPCPAHEINFTSAKTQRKAQLEAVRSPKPRKIVSPASYQDQQEFLGAIAGAKSVVLSVLEKHQDPFIVDMSVPDPLIFLRDKAMIGKPLGELVEHCSKLQIEVTESQACAVERLTRSQSKSTLWSKLRLGRVTASRLYSVCHTDISKPSLSVIKSIVSPTSFSTEAVKWGTTMEERAKTLYANAAELSHWNFQISSCGLIINPYYPFVAATPDSIITCACCGRGCLEIKCPFRAKDMRLFEATTIFKDFCLHVVDGKLKLKKDHSYYYQVQCQMFLSKTDYCDFFVYSNVDTFSERIDIDLDFIEPLIEKSKDFFYQVLLPEIVACHFSTTQTLKEKTYVGNEASASSTYCLCKKPEHGMMIKCENESCSIEWFHYGCVGIKRAPKGKWFCNVCKPQKKAKKRKL